MKAICIVALVLLLAACQTAYIDSGELDSPFRAWFVINLQLTEMHESGFDVRMETSDLPTLCQL